MDIRLKTDNLQGFSRFVLNKSPDKTTIKWNNIFNQLLYIYL